MSLKTVPPVDCKCAAAAAGIEDREWRGFLNAVARSVTRPRKTCFAKGPTLCVRVFFPCGFSNLVFSREPTFTVHFRTSDFCVRMTG